MSHRVTLGWPALAAAGIALIALGAGAVYLLAPKPPGSVERTAVALVPAARPADAGSNRTVTLTAEAVKRAGIAIVTVAGGAGRSSVVRLPGTVEANAYKEVVVTPLVAGRVTRVLAELGDQVRKGQTLMQIYSPELADSQTRYLSAQAELAAHEQELARTSRLTAIGAASRQEMERLDAEHTAKRAGLQSLRSRLVLLGMTAAAIDAMSPGTEVAATTSVPAPLAGVVTERAANLGLNVDSSTKVFTIVDLSSVWVVGALYERDFARVRLGSAVTITTDADLEHPRQGRVSYIDPQVDPQTRTAGVRVEVANPGATLKLGMYADVAITTAAADQSAVTLPRSAVQTVGSRQAVYVAGDAGTFTEREVQLGDASGDQVEVRSGIQPGDRVVTTGSFFVRAERERLGATSPAAAEPAPAAASADAVQKATIKVVATGFEPARLSLKGGVPVRLTFVRTTDQTCATAVVFPGLGLRRDLPLNQPVEIAFTPAPGKTVDFVCGMNMLRGAIVVE